MKDSQNRRTSASLFPLGSKSDPPLPPPSGRPVNAFLKICSKPKNFNTPTVHSCTSFQIVESKIKKNMSEIHPTNNIEREMFKRHTFVNGRVEPQASLVGSKHTLTIEQRPSEGKQSDKKFSNFEKGHRTGRHLQFPSFLTY